MARWVGYDLNKCEVWMNRERGLFRTNGSPVSDSDELLRILGGPVAEYISQRKRTDRLIVLPADHPDASHIIRLSRSLSGSLPYTYFQVDRQIDVAKVLKPAWPAIQAISSRLLRDLRTAEQTTLVGAELEGIVVAHAVARRETA
jgi:hypothetical protein